MQGDAIAYYFQNLMSPRAYLSNKLDLIVEILRPHRCRAVYQEEQVQFRLSPQSGYAPLQHCAQAFNFATATAGGRERVTGKF